MSSGGPNPYAPPAETTLAQTREIYLQMLGDHGPIPFRGSIKREHVNAYLRAYEHVGCISMLGTAIVLTLVFFIVMMFVGEAAFFVALGLVGLFALMMATSTLPYRRAVFVNSNPRWDSTIEGEIAADGVRINQDGAESFFRWDWFEMAVVGRQVLVLVPAIHPNHPIIVSASMLTTPADADRIPVLVNDLSASLQGTTETRAFDNRSVLRSSKRERSRGVLVGAIPFEGQVTSEDLDALPERTLQRQRPLRAYLLTGGLLIFSSLILIGLGLTSGLRTILALFLVVALLSLVLRSLWRRRRSSDVGAQTVFYLTAFADDGGITSDFTVTVTTVSWRSMQQVYADDKMIALSRGVIGQWIIARSDMFESDQRWQEFRELAKRHLS